MKYETMKHPHAPQEHKAMKNNIHHLQRLLSDNHARIVREHNSRNPYKWTAIAQLDAESRGFKQQLASLRATA